MERRATDFHELSGSIRELTIELRHQSQAVNSLIEDNREVKPKVIEYGIEITNIKQEMERKKNNDDVVYNRLKTAAVIALAGFLFTAYLAING